MRISDWSSDVCSSDLYKHDVGDTAHVADTAQRNVNLVTFAGELQYCLLGKAMGIARKLLFQRFEALDRLRNCFPVGEHAAQPVMVDKVLARFACSLGNWVLRLTLGSDEQHLAAMRHCLRHEIQRAREKRHGLGQVKNMYAIPLAEDVWLHARIPAVCLVAEMRAGLNQLLHGDRKSSSIHYSELQSLMS